MSAPGHPWRGYFYVAAATVCWGGAATFGKAIFQGTMFAGRAMISPLVLVQTRVTFAVLLLVPVLLLRDGPAGLRVSKRELALCALTGMGVAGSNFFYYYAIKLTTVAVAITLQYTAPVIVLLYMVLKGKQALTLQRTLAVFLAMLGTALTIGLFQQGISLNAAGAAAAMMAAVSFSVYNIAGQGMVSRRPPLTVMAWSLLTASLFWMAIDPPWRLAALHLSSGQWLFLFLFGCFSTLVPYVFYFNGLKYLDPTRAVITSCLEPVFAILLTAVFVHEMLRGLQAAGIVAVLVATVLAQRGR